MMAKDEKYWQIIEQTNQLKIKESEKSFIKRAYILYNVVDYVINQDTAKKYDDPVCDTVYFLLKRAESLGVGVLAIWYNFSDLNDVSNDGKCWTFEEKKPSSSYLEKLEKLYNEEGTMKDYSIVYNHDDLSANALQEFRQYLNSNEELLKKLLERNEFYELIV